MYSRIVTKSWIEKRSICWVLYVKFGASFIRYVTFIPGGVRFDTEIPIPQKIHYYMACQWCFCFKNDIFPHFFRVQWNEGPACTAWTGHAAYHLMVYETEYIMSVLIGFDINLMVFPAVNENDGIWNCRVFPRYLIHVTKSCVCFWLTFELGQTAFEDIFGASLHPITTNFSIFSVFVSSYR